MSTVELDFLADFGNAYGAGKVHGSRMTGGGFGGCTVSLVHAGSVAAFRRDVERAYRERFPGKACTVFATGAGAGARVLWCDGGGVEDGPVQASCGPGWEARPTFNP